MATCDPPTLFDELTSDEVPETDNSKSTFGFDIKTERTDLVFSVEGHRLHVSRIVLEMISPTFEALFRDKSLAGEPNVVNIEGKAYKDFVEFLNCIYPGKMSKVSSQNVYQVFPLACEFKVDFLKEKCETVLSEMLSNMKDGDDFVMQCYIDSHRSGFVKFKEESLRAIANQRLEKIETADKALPFDENTKCKIYEAMMPALRSEASRNRFGTVGTIQDYIKLSKFVDAKYKSIMFEFKHVQSRSKEEVHLESELWDLKIRIKVIKESDSEFVKVSVSLDQHSRISRCLLAMKWIIKNHKPTELDLCLLRIGTIPKHENNYPWNLNRKLEMYEIEDNADGFRIKGKYSMSIHILMNKPEYSSN